MPVNARPFNDGRKFKCRNGNRMLLNLHLKPQFFALPLLCTDAIPFNLCLEMVLGLIIDSLG